MTNPVQAAIAEATAAITRNHGWSGADRAAPEIAGAIRKALEPLMAALGPLVQEELDVPSASGLTGPTPAEARAVREAFLQLRQGLADA